MTPRQLQTAVRVLELSRSQASLTPAQEKRFGRIYRDLAALGWNNGVLGFALAEKITDGIATGQTCARIYVKRKVHKRRLRGEKPVPQDLVVQIGKDEWTLPTDVVELRRIPIAQRSLAPGDNIGHFSGTAGSIGVRVTGSTGKRFILTCSHVAAPAGAAPGQEIESPADQDRAPGPNVVGKLFSFTDLQPEEETHEVDAALVEVNSAHTISNDRLRLSDPPRFSQLSPTNFSAFRNRVVERFSRRVIDGSEQVVTLAGVVQSIANNLEFGFDFGRRKFKNVVEVAYTEPTQGGDSGSPVIDSVTRDVLGIHFSGVGNRGFFIMGSKIEERLQVVVV